MNEKKHESAKTEILHSEDLDYPLDVPVGQQPETTAFPSQQRLPEDHRTSVDPLAPLPYADAVSEPIVSDRVRGRRTADLGLAALRIVVGLLLALRGLQKLFGLFGGPGVEGFAAILSQAGFSYATPLAVAGGAVELVAAVALIVGLATPVASSALLGIGGLGLVILFGRPDTPALLGENTKGLEATVLYAGALFALLFTGPGRWSADRRWTWSHRPRFSGFVWLFVAAVTAGLIWYLLNGSNPLSAASDGGAMTAR